MSRKAPASGGTTTTTTTTGPAVGRTPEEQAQRDRALRLALRAQERPPPLTPEAQAEIAAFQRTMSVLDRQPTADQRAAEQEQAREAARVARNAKHAAEREAYRQTLRKSGYRGWTGGES
jgi:hypothetical protein